MNPRQALMLLWKELEEDRWFFYAGAMIFVVLPTYGTLVGGGLPYSGGSLLALTLMLLGSLLAVLVGVGTACRDLRGGVETFWRSRPINIQRWILIKYAIGLGVVLFIHAAALAAELAIFRAFAPALPSPPYTVAMLLYHSLSLTLIYSVAFLLGCLVRDAVQASILALAVVLLIYALPVLFPVLSFLSVHDLIDHIVVTPAYGRSNTVVPFSFLEHAGLTGRLARPWAAAGFSAAMVCGSLILTLLAASAVRHGRREKMNTRLLMWMIGGVALLLFGAGATQLGTNLTCERVVDLSGRKPSEGTSVLQFHMDGQRGTVTLHAYVEPNGEAGILRPIDMTRADPLGLPLPPRSGANLFWDESVMRVQYGDRTYRILALHDPPPPLTPNETPKGDRVLTLVTYDHDGTVINRLDLPPRNWNLSIFNMLIGHDRFYVSYLHPWFDDEQRRAIKDPLLVISLADPDHPQLKPQIPGPVRWPALAAIPDFDWSSAPPPPPEDVLLALPALPGWSARERLDACIEIAAQLHSANLTLVFRDDLLVTARRADRHLIIRRLAHLDETTARYDVVAEIEPTPLERLTSEVADHGDHSAKLLLVGHLLYVVNRQLHVGVTVYDLRDPARPRRAGHFAVPDDEIYAIAPLPEGRVLLGGRKLYVLAPPAER